MPHDPDAVFEAAVVWVQRPEGDLFFTHVPAGRKVIRTGETFHFEMHPQLQLKTSDIPKYLLEGRIRVRQGN